MTDLSLEQYKAKKISRQELKCLLQKEGESLLGADFIRVDRGERQSRIASQSLRSRLRFFKKEKKSLILSRKGT